MSNKFIIYIGIFIGSMIGGYIPTLWGDNFFSISSIIFSTIGALFGLYFAYKVSY